jgi:hypothetical protein
VFLAVGVVRLCGRVVASDLMLGQKSLQFSKVNWWKGKMDMNLGRARDKLKVTKTIATHGVPKLACARELIR